MVDKEKTNIIFSKYSYRLPSTCKSFGNLRSAIPEILEFWGFVVFGDFGVFRGLCVFRVFWGFWGVLGHSGVSGFGVFWVFGGFECLEVLWCLGFWGLRLRG